MPSTTDKSETSKKAKIKNNKRLLRKRSPTNYVENLNKNVPEAELPISPQENQSNNDDSKNSANKRKKNITNLLVSDLSPKYIGFNTTVDGKRRNRSESKTNVNILPTTPKRPSSSSSNIIENEGVLTNSLSYVKMTPINTKSDNLSSPSSSRNENFSPDFESPIEKLIKKNKELSNLTPSPSNFHQDNYHLKTESPKTINITLDAKLNKKSTFSEHDNEKLILINKNNEISTSPNPKILTKSPIGTNKLLNQMTIKKKKMKNPIKLVPLQNQRVLNDLSKKNDIESELSQEIEIRNLKNTPQKIRSAQVVIHKSPQIERMHNEQKMKNKKNSKIFQNVHKLSEMTTKQSNEDISTNNNKIEKLNLLPNLSNIEIINTEINNDKKCTLEHLSKTDDIADTHKTQLNSEISKVNENLTKNCIFFDNEENNKKSLNVSISSNTEIQHECSETNNDMAIVSLNVLSNTEIEHENHISTETEINNHMAIVSLNVSSYTEIQHENHISIETNNDVSIVASISEITKNSSSIIDEERTKTSTLLDNKNSPLKESETCTEIVTTRTNLNQSVKEIENIKNTQSKTSPQNVDYISETDLRTENLPISESPMENISISESPMKSSGNKKNENMEGVKIEELPDSINREVNDIIHPDEAAKISRFYNMKTYRKSTSTKQIDSKEIIQKKPQIMESSSSESESVEFDIKNHHMNNNNNKLLDTNKYSENDIHEIQNSELALENILYENDVLGIGSNIDEDFEIMNISSDFDDLNNSGELELPNLDVKTKTAQGIVANDEDICIINNNDTFIKNNSSITNKANEEIFETISDIIPVQKTISSVVKFNEIISNNLTDKNLPGSADLINASSYESKAQIQGILKKDQNEKQLNETENLPSTSGRNKAPDNDAFAYTLMSNARSTKSPLSTDSAKGSSIDIETNFHPKFGEIFWARISKYPYWPCIVWPDPDGKTISIGKNGSRQHIRIHVKFFADNGRRSWIRREDLMAYNGREDFERKKKMFWQTNVSKKNILARAYLVNESKKPLWNQAIIEASLVLNEHIEKRSEKFEKILEETRELQFFERRKKRLSLNDRRSSISSIAASDDILNNSINNSYPIVRKRERSPTPESPPFEDVEDFKTFFKKRKIGSNTTSNNFNQLKKTSSLMHLNQHASNSNYNLCESEDIDFNGFTELMTAFIQPEKEEEQSLFVNLKEIWEIKLRSEATKNFNLSQQNNNSLDGGEQSFKRFSKRVTTLSFRRSLPVQKRSFVTKDKGDKPKRERLPGVPIVKVVEDILELNKNYLFNGLKREPVCKVCLKPTNLHKCSANCQSWIHETCADLPEAITFPLKMKDKKSIQNYNNNNLAINNSNIKITDPPVSMHITGDESLLKEIDDNNKINNESNINGNEDILNSSIPVFESIQTIDIMCKECREKQPPICYVCKKNAKPNINEIEVIQETPIKCNINSCGKYLHISCLKYWPQARLTKSKTKVERFICPSHTCQTCVSDDPKGKFLKLQNCTKCILCPASYHIDSTCIPAGSKIITATELICPRHRQNKQILNTNWCFICSDGGNLVCCESCPTSFHLECINIDKLPEAGYICEECETGRLPLYGELIWAKFGVHKWWPCITIPPPQIPRNLYRIKHNDFDFCVRFFGTNDHSWISRDRVFLYQEDDWRYSSKVRTNDKDFIKALEEANSISELLKAKKILHRKYNDKKMLLVPTPYKKININRPVPPVKLQEIDVSDDLNPCDCNPNSEKPCDIFSQCLNRMLMIECHPKICPAGNKCNNQMFEKRLYAAVKVTRTSGKGFGLVSEELITAGTFIIEYVGELIDDNELKRRIAQKQEEKDENYYFLTMQHGLVIDAGPKGNMARFMNHSCEPNCETQKWNVNGNTRIGLFAINDITPDTELTFNYNLECIGDDRKPCYCGADKCAGFIGAKYKKTDKKIVKETLGSEISKTEKSKLKGGKRNKASLVLGSNLPAPTVTTIPKNS